MGNIASWNNHNFTVSPSLIRGFTGLTITSGSETEEKTSNSQNYAYRKNGAPSEVALTVELNALTGCDVKKEALAFISEAHAGAQSYFYIGGKKLLTCQLMLTEAQVSEVSLSANGGWIGCKVALTMLQCSKMDGSTGSTSSASSSGSKKTSVKTSGFITGIVEGAKAVADTVKGVLTAASASLATKTTSSPLANVAAMSAAVAKSKEAITAGKAASSTSTTTKKTAPKLSVGSKDIKAISFAP